MNEAGVVLDKHGMPIYWHLPLIRTDTSLPDSPLLWVVIWANRTNLSGFAHTHPGSGIPAPSNTDATTFAAIEAALGRRLDWWIASSTDIVLVQWSQTLGDYNIQHVWTEALPWVARLRKLSGFIKVE